MTIGKGKGVVVMLCLGATINKTQITTFKLLTSRSAKPHDFELTQM